MVVQQDSSIRIPRQCLLKIKAVYEGLKRAERRAVDFILREPEQIKNLTVMEFADRAGCSEATVVRISRKLGYSGYSHFREALGSSADDDGGVGYNGISTDDNYTAVMRKVFHATVEAVQDTANIIAEDEYEHAVGALLDAPNILFCGVGDAALVAMEAYQRFMRIGTDCHVSEDPDLQVIMASHLKVGDVLVAVSHSGRSRTVVNTVKIAKESGATVIAITNFPNTPLTKSSDIVLLTAVFYEHSTGEVLSKRVAELCIVESLYVNIVIKKGERARESLNRANTAVGVNKL